MPKAIKLLTTVDILIPDSLLLISSSNLIMQTKTKIILIWCIALAILAFAMQNVLIFSIFILIPGSVYVLDVFKNKEGKWIQFIFSFIKLIGIVLLFLTVFRFYVVDVFKIPSGSMEQTLDIGDKILVKKDFQHELSHNKWFSSAFHLEASYQPQRQEICVFRFPKNTKLHFVKRCVGLPGDVLSIRKSDIICNGDTLENAPTMQWMYRMSGVDSIDIVSILNGAFKRTVSKQIDKNHTLRFHLSLNEALALDTLCPNLHFNKCNWGAQIPSKVYPYSVYQAGTRDNMGPFVVPQKGLTIPMNPLNIAWYSDIINAENSNVDVTDSVLIIDQTQVFTYTFKQNYYYMMGDNRHASQDSRFWGFVPQQNIVGNVVGIFRNWKWVDVH